MKKNTMQIRARATDVLQCDFCGTPTPGTELTSFPCSDYERRAIVRNQLMMVETCTCHAPIAIEPGDEVTVHRVQGAWTACRKCARAVRAGDQDRLAAIAAKSPSLMKFDLAESAMFIAESGAPNTERQSSLQEHVASQHLGFWLHRLSES